MSADCDMTFSQKIKDNIGVEMVLLDSQIFTDASIDSLKSLSAKVHIIFKEKSADMTALMAKLAINR